MVRKTFWAMLEQQEFWSEYIPMKPPEMSFPTTVLPPDSKSNSIAIELSMNKLSEIVALAMYTRTPIPEYRFAPCIEFVIVLFSTRAFA